MNAASPGQLRSVRRLDLGAVFQDPMTSLNPTMRIGRQVAEAAGSMEDAVRLMTAVGIPDADRRASSFPHELSGGLRQRVMIAMAVAGEPSLIIADEPTTALDVTVQAQVLMLLRNLRDELGCSVLLVTHDLGVAAQIADRVAVMYAGRLAEVGPTHDVLVDAAHPYTLALMRSRLSLTTDRARPLLALTGEVLDPSAQPPGCSFQPRCAAAVDECLSTRPELTDVRTGHSRACLRPADVARHEVAAEQNVSAPTLANPIRGHIRRATTAAAADRHHPHLRCPHRVRQNCRAEGTEVGLVGHSRGRVLGAGRRERLRKVDVAESDCRARETRWRQRGACLRTAAADGVPGRRRFAHTVADSGGDRRRATARPWRVSRRA